MRGIGQCRFVRCALISSCGRRRGRGVRGGGEWWSDGMVGTDFWIYGLLDWWIGQSSLRKGLAPSKRPPLPSPLLLAGRRGRRRFAWLFECRKTLLWGRV